MTTQQIQILCQCTTRLKNFIEHCFSLAHNLQLSLLFTEVRAEKSRTKSTWSLHPSLELEKTTLPFFHLHSFAWKMQRPHKTLRRLRYAVSLSKTALTKQHGRTVWFFSEHPLCPQDVNRIYIFSSQGVPIFLCTYQQLENITEVHVVECYLAKD